MNLLLIDTALDYLSLGISQEGQLQVHAYQHTPQKNTGILFQTMEDLLLEAQLTLEDIDGYVVTCGPGSYTGLRIGMAVAKTWAQIHQKPLLGIPVLELLAFQTTPHDLPFHTLLNCTRNEVFHQQFQWKNQQLHRVSDIQMGPLSELTSLLQTQAIRFHRIPSAQKRSYPELDLIQSLPLQYPEPSPEVMLAYVQQQESLLKWTSAIELHPIYIKREV